jgi:hypothetical protein
VERAFCYHVRKNKPLGFDGLEFWVAAWVVVLLELFFR